MQAQRIDWKIFAGTTQLREAACEAVLENAAAAIAERGRFLIVLAGGSTPREVYSQLREAATDWTKWHIYFGDERCLPPQHEERNSRMAQDSLLQHVPVPPDQIHAVPAELGAQKGAQAYSRLLAGVGQFDLVLLGLGEDAHTASLFPGQSWESPLLAPAIAVSAAPKPPPERVSLAASRLSHARRVIFLVTGAGKRAAVERWRSGQVLPAAAIHPAEGVEVFMDASAVPTVEIQ